MKLGYRDRVILLVACVIIIFCIGIFIFIKPKWEELQKNDEKLKNDSESWNQQLDQFNNITTKQENINKKYEKGKEIAAEFTNSMDAIEFDRFLQKNFMNTDTHVANGLKVQGSVSFRDAATTSINYYYYTPSVLTYPLYTLADMDGSLAKATQEKLAESTSLAQLPGQTVSSGRTSLTLVTTKQDLMKLLKSVHDYAVNNHDAMLIHSVNISDYYFNLQPGEKLDIAEGIEKDEDGKIKPAEMKVVKVTKEDDEKKDQTANTDNQNEKETDKDKEKKALKGGLKEGYAQVVIDYEAYYLQEPMKPDVGPAYDAAVWDNDTWKTYTSKDGAK